MKSNARLWALAVLLSANASAAPFVAIGDNAELFLTASTSVSIDDNIYLRSAGEVDDTILNFAPGLDLVFGRNAATSGNVFYRHEFLKYMDVSQQDTNLAHAGINTLYQNGKSKLDFGVGYDEFATNEPSAPGAIVERTVTAVRAVGEVGVTEKTSVGGGVRFENTDYALGGSYKDSDIVTIPLDVYFEYSPKLQASLGYRYRSTDLAAGGIGSKDHFLNVGARGEFTPKLVGQVRLGYVTRKFDNSRDDSSFGADANLNFAATAKTSLTLGFTSDYGSSATGDSTQTTSFNAGLNNRIDDQWSWNANLAYRAIDYPTRSDDFFQGGVGIAYTYNSFVNFAGSITHRSQSSPLASAEFDNNVFSLAANIRY
ncbi:MAG: hypothetical protein C0518_04290 [Opitutus sp.]|nr:hypothetical protein [Opitutus sp.]